MKKIITCGFLFLLFKVAIGQNYYPMPKSNAIWNIYSDNVFSIDQYWMRYGLIGDSLINDTLYSKMYLLINDTSLEITNTNYLSISGYDDIRRQNLMGFVREDSDKKIYFRDTLDKETIIYDFSMNVGDSIIYSHSIIMVSDYSVLTISGLHNYENSDKVISIDSAMINGVYRKRLNFISGFSCVEGIGCVGSNGFFAPITDFCTCGDEFFLACYKNNDTVLILNNPKCSRCFCSIYTNNPEEKWEAVKDIFIYPNPLNSSSDATITLNVNSDFLKIFNQKGQLVLQEKTIENSINIGKNNLNKGLYLLQIFDDDKFIATCKFIVE